MREGTEVDDWELGELREHGEEGRGGEGGGVGGHGSDGSWNEGKLERSLDTVMTASSPKRRRSVAIHVYTKPENCVLDFKHSSAAPDAHSVKPQEVAVLKRRIRVPKEAL